MTIDETVVTQPKPPRGRAGHQPPPPRPSTSCWQDFEDSIFSPLPIDLAMVRSTELDHAYYKSSSRYVLELRSQVKDGRTSINEDDSWAPEPEYESLSPTQVQASPIKTVLREGLGQLQSLRGSHRVERHSSQSYTSDEVSQDEQDFTNSQNDSLGDLENLIQGDMSDIMLAAEQYLQESSLMNDSLDGLTSPNTSSELLLQDSFMELPASNTTQITTSPVRYTKGTEAISSDRLNQSPRRTFSPKKKVPANRPLILPKFSPERPPNQITKKTPTKVQKFILSPSSSSAVDELPLMEHETLLDNNFEMDDFDDSDGIDIPSLSADGNVILQSPEDGSPKCITASPITSSPKTVFVSPPGKTVILPMSQNVKAVPSSGKQAGTKSTMVFPRNLTLNSGNPQSSSQGSKVKVIRIIQSGTKVMPSTSQTQCIVLPKTKSEVARTVAASTASSEVADAVASISEERTFFDELSENLFAHNVDHAEES